MLNFEVARKFLSTGKIEPSYRFPENWYEENHTGEVQKIGKYSVYAKYDAETKKTAVVVMRGSGQMISETITMGIYEAFKDDEEAPTFGYDGGYTSDPTLVNVTYEYIRAADDLLKAMNWTNKRISYFFSDNVINCIMDGSSEEYKKKIFTKENYERFSKNMQKYEVREKNEASTIYLYTMKQVEFVTTLLKVAD